MPNRIRDIFGNRYGRLIAVARVGKYANGSSKWRFICDCGKETEASIGNVEFGHVRSCGCLQEEIRQIGTNHTHGFSKLLEFRSFKSAKARCENPLNNRYKYYGARGIRFLFTSFEQFIAELGPKPSGMQIDRIDNDGNYEPGNVRWATPKQQANNRRQGKLGYVHSKNTREAISNALRGKPNFGHHTRWHVRRNISVSNCSFCQQVET